MKTMLLLFLQGLLLSPCLSQSINAEVQFFTRQGKTYTGLVTALTEDSCTVLFESFGLSISFGIHQLSAMNKQTGSKAAKQAAAFGDEVEERLRQQAALQLGDRLQQCSYPESARLQCCYRFCELRGCDLYLFYTTKGYDISGTDYHIVKIDLAAMFSTNAFGMAQSVAVRSRSQQPVIEIAKHTRSAAYMKEQFYTDDGWDNQPQYLTDLRLCFLDEHKPAYPSAVKELDQLLVFLSQSCKKKK
jgi:hypothetical protein